MRLNRNACLICIDSSSREFVAPIGLYLPPSAAGRNSSNMDRLNGARFIKKKLYGFRVGLRMTSLMKLFGSCVTIARTA